MQNSTNYLSPTWFLDYETEIIQEMVRPYRELSPKAQAIACYLKVRDGWRYTAYKISFTKEKWKASEIAQRTEGHCLDKSILLTACLRALGIPSRLHLAKVKNHIGVERLIQVLGTNELTPHGMVNIFLKEEWLKASPAFNKGLCEKCGVPVLEFDGEKDSVFQAYNQEGKEFMEYLEDYGHFSDVPLDFIMENMSSHYPQLKDFLID